jgi:hypothetical protein
MGVSVRVPLRLQVGHTEVLTMLAVVEGDSQWRLATEVSAIMSSWLASRCQSVESALRCGLEGSAALVAEEEQCRAHPCGRSRLLLLAL